MKENKASDRRYDREFKTAAALVRGESVRREPGAPDRASDVLRIALAGC